MGYTEPTTRTTGDLITASIWNTDLTDNISYLNTNKGILNAIAYSRLGGAGTFSFTGISASYDDLFVKMVLRGAASATNENIVVRFNNDSGASYENQYVYGQSTTLVGAQATGQTSLMVGVNVNADTATANSFSVLHLMIPAYASTSIFKLGLLFNGGMRGSTANFVQIASGEWANTAAVDRIDISAAGGNFTANSEVSIYAGQSI